LATVDNLADSIALRELIGGTGEGRLRAVAEQKDALQR